jgi:hypothetical protein
MVQDMERTCPKGETKARTSSSVAVRASMPMKSLASGRSASDSSPFAYDSCMVLVIDGIVCLPCSAMMAFSACTRPLASEIQYSAKERERKR